MTLIFLSYTDSDDSIAERLTATLRTAGAEVFRWKDHGGSPFVENIQEELERADLFVALISPQSLTAAWCRRERVTAFHREIELKRQFVHVFKVKETPVTGTGFLRTYAWVDLTEPVGDSKLLHALKTLDLGRERLSEPTQSPWTVFRNREDELSRILNALTTTGTEDLWLVVSPPKMGKSWFLQQVVRDLANRLPDCRSQLVDLRTLPPEYRFDWVKLLCLLLDVDEPRSGTLISDDLLTIAATVSKRACPQLYLLDSAELLDQTAATELRSALTAVYQRVQLSGNDKTRMSVMVGSRRQEEWQGFGRVGGMLFRALPLTEFSVVVVRHAIQEFRRSFGNETVNRWAEALHHLSEGLPAVLVAGLRWAEDSEFVRLEACEAATSSVFDEVARPYIKNDLLSIESMLPFGGEDVAKRKAVLEVALRATVPYRIFTQSHLRYHVENDAAFQRSLDAAGWELPDLWRAMSRTALLKRPSEELWQVLNPPIRRLLYRYYYPDAESRLASHVVARQFYEKWAVTGAGGEQGVVLVECLWHETAKLLHEDADALASVLPGTAVQLANSFRRPENFEPPEFGEYVTRRLESDAEFAKLVRRFDGLFDEVVTKIGEAIAGGA